MPGVISNKRLLNQSGVDNMMRRKVDLKTYIGFGKCNERVSDIHICSTETKE